MGAENAECNFRMALAECMSDEKIDEMLNQYFQDRLAVLMESRDATTCISASTLFRQGEK